MKALQEIKSVSDFQPDSGDLLDLFQLVSLTPALNREQLQTAFLGEERTKNHFRVVYKELKDRLLDGMFIHSFKDYSNVLKARIRVFKSCANARMLIASGKKKAGVTIALETFKQSKKYGILDVAYTMSRELHSHYSVVQPDRKKHCHFQAEKKRLFSLVQQEVQSEEAYLHIALCINTGKMPDNFSKKLETLAAFENQEYRFNLFYYSSRTLFAYLQNDANELIEWCGQALRFFSTIKHPLPYIIKWGFYAQAVPVLIGRGEYAKAHAYLSSSVDGPLKGSFNWHVSLLYMAVQGFHSGKPKIAFESWKQAKRQASKFESGVIRERWKVMEAYLHFFDKGGHFKMPGQFRLGRFLNETIESSKRKPGQNVAIIIVQMLHFLQDGKHRQYMKRADNLKKYIQDHLKGDLYKRSRLFLMMLQQVEFGDYKRDRVEELTEKYLVQLRSTEISIGVDLLDNEVVRYEVLWEEVIKTLR